ncbi:MAG TPA: hypothetical protein VH969_28375 [Actinophytocola sp.]
MSRFTQAARRLWTVAIAHPKVTMLVFGYTVALPAVFAVAKWYPMM